MKINRVLCLSTNITIDVKGMIHAHTSLSVDKLNSIEEIDFFGCINKLLYYAICRDFFISMLNYIALHIFLISKSAWVH